MDIVHEASTEMFIYISHRAHANIASNIKYTMNTSTRSFHSRPSFVSIYFHRFSIVRQHNESTTSICCKYRVEIFTLGPTSYVGEALRPTWVSVCAFRRALATTFASHQPSEELLMVQNHFAHVSHHLSTFAAIRTHTHITHTRIHRHAGRQAVRQQLGCSQTPKRKHTVYTVGGSTWNVCLTVSAIASPIDTTTTHPNYTYDRLDAKHFRYYNKTHTHLSA